jgi:hypothetical protein
MPYVERDQSGKIKGLYVIRQAGYAEEYLSDDNPEVLGFLSPFASVPTSISRRQFFQVLAVRDIITRQEALDAVATGAIPEAMEQLIQMLADEDLQWNARMVISGATDFERLNWFVDVFGQLRNMTPGEIDQLWTDGHALS